MIEPPSFLHTDAGTDEAKWAIRPEWEDVAELDLPQPGVIRLVVVAAHPDDETLGAGGLLARAADAGLDIHVVLVTRGEASHPDSPTHTPDVLGQLRVEETSAALALLAPDARLSVLDVPDGRVAEDEGTVVAAVVDAVAEAGSTTLICAPWRQDGHADHEAVGRAAALAAARTDARLLEYPVWWWLWAEPRSAPWARFRRLPLDADLRARKERAVATYRTQVGPLSDQFGDEALLRPDLLAYFRRDAETFVEEELPADDAFDRLHREHQDPWAVDTSWYEQRKREITLAMLPRERFGRALEIGCSTGALTAALADRCAEVLGVDTSVVAVQAAHDRLRDLGWARAEHRHLPQEWPEGRWDLVVVSEVGYFLSPGRLRELVARVEESLADDGVVVLCHWWHEVRGWPLDGPRVHELWRLTGRLPVLAEHREADFAVVVLGRTTDHRHPDHPEAEPA